jgi:hypothetical protein
MALLLGLRCAPTAGRPPDVLVPVQDAHDTDGVAMALVENDVTALHKAPVTLQDIRPRNTESRILCQHLEALKQARIIGFGLPRTPVLCRIVVDAPQVVGRQVAY